MRLEKINLGETGNHFSPIFLDYIEGAEKLAPFYDHRPDTAAFKEAIGHKKFAKESRNLIADVLLTQYENREGEKVKANIEALRQEKTFTITTGHQLNIFTGPLYFIYKIVTVINACKVLQKQYPDFHFVPVYWMASEDHDFDEISHFTLFGNTHTWETNQKGPVGRFSTKDMAKLLESIPEKLPLFEKAYTENATLATATQHYVHELFGQEGLVVVDGDDVRLKKAFIPVIKDDILESHANKLVEETSSRLESLHYKSQVFPREINFFYMEDAVRERIVREDGRYKVLHTDLSFSESEIAKLIEDFPEKFSPNVVLRPLYQELLLPNLAYIGGPAEVAYWLQLKAVFQHYNVPFPVIMPRNFALIINKNNARKFDKLDLEAKHLFLPFHELKQIYIDSQVENGYHLEKEKESLAALFETIKTKAIEKDKSLEGFVGAEATKALKSLENISKRLQKAEEQKQSTAIHQLENLKESLFPGNGLQERKENILNFYINTPGIIQQFLDNFDPFDFRFNVIVEDE